MNPMTAFALGQGVGAAQGLLRVCAVTRRRFPVGANPTRQPLQPEATGAVMEETKWLKPSVSVSRIGGSQGFCCPDSDCRSTMCIATLHLPQPACFTRMYHSTRRRT